MFDYEVISRDELVEICKSLPKKIIRWLGEKHPDNRMRKIFFQISGIEIGEGTVINRNFVVSDDYENLLKIGKRVSISPNVTIICDSNPNNSFLLHNSYVSGKLVTKKRVIIEDDAWIGANVVILPGVTIGEASIVGAGSVVNKSVRPHTIVAGVPAKVIRHL
ncbi:MAG: acyltransferase [Candidatus Hodarchaeota archaeon]